VFILLILLRVARDRKRWCYWLFETKECFGLCLLNDSVTSNHIHLLVRDRGGDETYHLREHAVAYRIDYGREMTTLSDQNAVFMD
jgi:lipoate-protein ligase B